MTSIHIWEQEVYNILKGIRTDSNFKETWANILGPMDILSVHYDDNEMYQWLKETVNSNTDQIYHQRRLQGLNPWCCTHSYKDHCSDTTDHYYIGLY